MVEDLFAEAEILGSDLEVFVLGQIFGTTLETMLERRAELDAFAVPLGAHVGEVS